MRTAARGGASPSRVHEFARRPLHLLVGFFAAVLLLSNACRDQLPTEVTHGSTVVPRLNISAGDGPKIATDKEDYAPGETVEIIGWDWEPGETVRLHVVHLTEEGEAAIDDERLEHQPWDVAADANGHITSSWLVPEDDGGASLKLTADGDVSGAHAELMFSDLNGTVALYSDAARTIGQTAYPWGATVYPRLTGANSNFCYQITWKDPSNAVVQGPTTFGPGATSYDPAGYPIPATGPSGTYSVIVAQNNTGNCGGPFGNAADPVLFDVARAVIIGAGTAADDATGGDQCVYAGGPPVGGCAATDVNLWVRSHSAGNAHTFLRFDLTAASPAAIPAGAIVTDAKVRLTIIGTPGADRLYDIQRANAAWDEGNLGAFPGPATTGTIATTTILATALTPGGGGGDPQTWYKWNVTTHVQGFLDASFTNHGWRISDQAQDAGSPRTSRFASTEDTRRRVWPVLLVDYTDPPKLVFYTTAFTGVVGECLGPIKVQSKAFAGSVLPVDGDLTVDLSTANLGVGDVFGTAGAGSFFSNSTCTTSTTTTTIPDGESISNGFYYRATHRGDGGHDVIASATGYSPNPSQTQTINKAITNIVYDGDLIVIPGNTFTMKAILSSTYDDCEYAGSTTPYGRRVLFRIAPNPTTGTPGSNLGFGFIFTNSSGVAQTTSATTTWLDGMYELTVNAIDNDNCTAQKVVPDPVIAVLSPGNAATGGGFLAGTKVGGGRVNFGFNVRPIEGSDPVDYKGQLLLIRMDAGVPSFRCKGDITFYGVVSSSDPLQNFATGTCDFQAWDPSLNSGEGGWYVPGGGGYTNRPFTIEFIDNGSGKGKNAPPPDEFGFSISFVGTNGYADPSFDRAPINGGNIDVKTNGSSATSTGGTEEGSSPAKGGKKK